MRSRWARIPHILVSDEKDVESRLFRLLNQFAVLELVPADLTCVEDFMAIRHSQWALEHHCRKGWSSVSRRIAQALNRETQDRPDFFGGHVEDLGDFLN